MASIEAEDTQRLNRLSEEVRSRLAEITMILARVSRDPKLENATVMKFTAKGADRKHKLQNEGDWIEIIDVDGQEACYGVINGKPFAESPCGAS